MKLQEKIIYYKLKQEIIKLLNKKWDKSNYHFNICNFCISQLNDVVITVDLKYNDNRDNKTHLFKGYGFYNRTYASNELEILIFHKLKEYYEFKR